MKTANRAETKGRGQMGAERDAEGPGVSTYSASVANSLLGRGILGRLGIRHLMSLRDRARNRPGPDLQLTQRRPLYIIALLLIITSVLTQYALIFVCALLLLGIAIVPELWYRYGLRGLVVSREQPTSRASFGSVVTTTLQVENRKLLPLPMVETIDELPEQLTVLGLRLGLSTRPGSALLARGLRLWTYQRVRRRYYLRAVQRGAYILGPTVARVTDPFGILTREVTCDTSRALLVHPLVAPLERFGLSPRALFGDHASRRRLLEDPLRVTGVREYMAGDDPRRIHWKATARLGALQSKTLDPATQRTLLIALDVRTFSQAQLGYDPELAELGVAVAGSVAAWAIQRGYAVGLIANGAFSDVTPQRDGRPATPTSASIGVPELPRLRLEPAARPEQLTQILDSLARVRLFGGAPMAALLTSEMRLAPTGATLVYVGLESLVDVPTMIALRRAQASGHEVALVLTERKGDDPFAEMSEQHNLHAAGVPIHYVGGRARWQALVTEALGDLPPRTASDLLNDDHLAAERALILEYRQANMPRQQQRKEDEDGAVAATGRPDDTGQPSKPPLSPALARN